MEYWIWLSLLPYIGPVTANHLLKYFGDPLQIYTAEMQELSKVRGLTRRQINSVIENKSLERSYGIMKECDKWNISVLLQSNLSYPERAKMTGDAPIVLYYKGCIRELTNTVGIVGARRCTQAAKNQAVKITEQYVEKKSIIVSGMAKGIDSYAHTACLKSGGYTVAILGNGLDICYPCEHKKLMECITERGLLISEYPPGTRPTKYTFPRRNRLISAWSDRLIVIAPGKGSGALITAEYGEKYGRQVEIFS